MKISLIGVILGLTLVTAGCAHFRTMKASDFFEAGPQRSLAKAAAKGRLSEIDTLLKQGISVNFQGKEGMTVLIWVLMQQNKKGYEYLLNKGANPNLQIGESTLTSDGLIDGNSATSLAAMHEDPWWLEVTLKHGGDPNIFNPIKAHDSRPIFACIQLLDRRNPKPRMEQLKMLIAAGADLNATDKDNLTPLMCAVMANRYDMAYVMLKAGADPWRKSRWSTTIIYEMREMHTDPKSELYQWRLKVIDLLKEKGLDVRGL